VGHIDISRTPMLSSVCNCVLVLSAILLWTADGNSKMAEYAYIIG